MRQRAAVEARSITTGSEPSTSERAGRPLEQVDEDVDGLGARLGERHGAFTSAVM